MSIYEETTLSTSTPMMGVFNNLVVFDPNQAQNRLDNIIPDLAGPAVSRSAVGNGCSAR
jgi:peptide/nickel transport system substrate-binding protein